MAEHDNSSAPTLSLTASKLAQQFWAERAGGRAVSVDELLETSPGTPEHDALRSSVIQLIAAQAATFSGGVATPDIENSQRIVEALGDNGPIPTIDGYDLVGCLGRGGMGAVYEGYQQSTGRRVAVKFMLETIGSADSARKRFEREVEVVARLQHPSIVSIVDSGVRRGRYFYAMEYVEGQPLNGAMPPGRCDPRDAMKVIALIADAVDYAHQRGVLHRDLKPSNIVVDSHLQPHLLDFGLAKVFDPKSGDGETHGRLGLTVSGPGQLLGTVAYMSPEQAEGRHDETSVRTDVYALGAIAYELLTGRLPIEVSGSLHDVLKKIIEHDPPAPSKVRPGLSRDLDAVLLKALNKSPEQRYATAGELAADLRRVLAGEPVIARSVGALGRGWRWVRRNRAVATVAAAGIIALVVVTAVLMSQIIRESEVAAMERDLARENFERLRRILESADPARSPGGATVLQLLDTATREIDESPPDRDLAEAQIREVLGNVYRNLGEYGKARDHQTRALEIRKRHASRDADPVVAAGLHNLAATLWWDGAFAEAEKLYMQSLEIRRRLHAGDHPDIAFSLTHLAACRLRMGRYDDALAMYYEALAMRQRLYGSEHEEVAQALNNLAKCLLEADDFEEAEELHRQALEMIRRLRGDSFIGTAAASQNLGECLLRRSEAETVTGSAAASTRSAEAALEAFERALDIRTATFPSGHHLVAASLEGLARAKLQLGRLDEAEELARQSVEEYRRTRREDHPDLAAAFGTLGAVMKARGEAAAAAEVLEHALGIAEQTRPPDESLLAQLRGDLGTALATIGQWSRSEDLLLRSYADTQAFRGSDAIDTVVAARRLVHYYTRRGDTERADGYRKAARFPD